MCPTWISGLHVEELMDAAARTDLTGISTVISDVHVGQNP